MSTMVTATGRDRDIRLLEQNKTDTKYLLFCDLDLVIESLQRVSVVIVHRVTALVTLRT